MFSNVHPYYCRERFPPLNFMRSVLFEFRPIIHVYLFAEI